MLIPLPGGHFADPTTVAAVYRENCGDGGHLVLLTTHNGGQATVGLFTARDTAMEYVAEVAAVINAALAPKDVATVEVLPEAVRKAMLNLCRGVATFAHRLPADTQDDLREAITLLESTPPKPSPEGPCPSPPDNLFKQSP